MRLKLPTELRVLLLGSGGREHAIACALSNSPLVSNIEVCPGNGGTASGLAKVSNLTHISGSDYAALKDYCLEKGINLVVIGPEVPLVEGAGDIFRDAKIDIFGPSEAAARLEGGKGFSKDFMKQHGIPTAAYERFTEFNAARKYVESVSHRIVIKADGLAAGKGVILPESIEESLEALESIMVKKQFGEAGNEVVIEEYLEGDELSIISFCDGHTFQSLPPAQDHKRAYDGDKGPNTGGMGCYAPTTIASKELLADIDINILQPTFDGARNEGFPFVGVLFTGLMITPNGPRVLEYNVRFGDPETQTLLPLLITDLAEIMWACVTSRLDFIKLELRPEFSATVVIAAGGYPNSYAKGTPISIGESPQDVSIYHAGTAISSQGGQTTTSGGRVFAVNAIGATLKEAVEKAYAGVKIVKFDNLHYRNDIAHRAFRQPVQSSVPLTYASAGVSIDAGNDFVKAIKPLVATTRRPGTEAKIGGFGGTFDLAEAGYTSLPLLVAAIDGIGTKLKVAIAAGKHDTVGIDLVAMNVNDLLVQGADPLLFLDYFSCSKLVTDIAVSFVTGVVEGCRQAGCALVGGETAEMPGIYQNEDYDAAGAAVGAVEQNRLLPKKADMIPGDVLIGLSSNGVHSNGFSLVQKIIKVQNLSYNDAAPWDGKANTAESLLKPTRIYAKVLAGPIQKNLLKGMAHITGGGLIDNVPRMLPDHLAAQLNPAKWPVPAVLPWLKEAGSMADLEYYRTFNAGLGMVLVVSEELIPAVLEELLVNGETGHVVGQLVERKGTEGCVIGAQQ